MRTPTLLSSVVTSILCSASAAATDPLPAATNGKLWLDGSTRLGLFVQDEESDSFVFTARASALVPVGRNGALELRAGFAFASFGDRQQAVTSNFLIGYALPVTPDLRFTPALVFPSAAIVPARDSDSDGDGSGFMKLFTHFVALQAFGLHEFWMHAPESVSIVLPLRADYRLTPAIGFEVNATAAVIFMSDGAFLFRQERGDDLELFIDTEMGVLFSIVRVGFGIVFVPTFETDQARASASIGVSVPSGAERQGRFHADLLFELDHPAFFDAEAAPSFGIGYTTPL